MTSANYPFREILNQLLTRVIIFLLVAISFHAHVLAADNPVSSQSKFLEGPGDLSDIRYGWFVGGGVGPNLFYGDVSLYNIAPKFSELRRSSGTGYSLSGGKKFNHGIAAELQINTGKLKGEKIADKLYPRYFIADFMSYSVNFKYNLSAEISRKKSNFLHNRFTLYSTLGVGQVFFRSRLYKQAYSGDWYLERVTGFKAENIDQAGPTSGGGLILEKESKMPSSFIIPVGLKLNFKINYKVDLVLDASFVSTFSDDLDSWNRAWSKKDKYLTTDIGLMYTIGANPEDDVQSSDKLFKRKKKYHKLSNDDAFDSGSKKNRGSYPGSTSTSEKKGFLKRKKGSSSDDRDLEVKLKLYELQLKLFEMQFLMNDPGGKSGK